MGRLLKVKVTTEVVTSLPRLTIPQVVPSAESDTLTHLPGTLTVEWRAPEWTLYPSGGKRSIPLVLIAHFIT